MLESILVGLILGLVSAGDPSPSLTVPKDKPVVIKAGRLFDGTGDVHRTGQVIVIEGERITAVGPAGQVKVPEGAEVIDLTGATVLPGLIDAHTHIGSRADRYEEIAKFKDTPFQSAFAAVKHAKITLESGLHHDPRPRQPAVPGGRPAARRSTRVSSPGRGSWPADRGSRSPEGTAI